MKKRKQELQPLGGSRRRANWQASGADAGAGEPSGRRPTPMAKPLPIGRRPVPKGTVAAANRMMPVKEELVEAEDGENIARSWEELQVEEPDEADGELQAERRKLEEHRQKLKENEGLKRRLTRREAAAEQKKMELIESITDQEAKLMEGRNELERTERNLANLQARYKKAEKAERYFKKQISFWKGLLYDEHTYEEEGGLYEQEDSEFGDPGYW